MTLSRPNRMQTLGWLGAGIVLLWILWLLAPILTPFAVAAVFAYVCDPAVNWLAARRMPRAAAVLLVILALGLLLLLLLLILAPMVYKEGAALAQRLPDLLELLNTRTRPWLESEFGIVLQLHVGAVRQWVAGNWDTAQDVLGLLLARAKTSGVAVIGLVGNLFLIPIVMFYLLQEWPKILDYLDESIPRPLHDRTMALIGEIDSVLSEFLRGQLSVMLLLAVFYSIGLWLAGLRFALPVGVITGLLVFIPYVGFSTGLLLAILTALLQGGWGPLIGVGVVFTIGQVLESFLLTPYLVGERIGLHPLAVIFALMAFGHLFGFVGMLVALPVSAALLVGMRELRKGYLASHVYLGDEDGGSQA
ncbi:MAG: AI-2E family transporter [Rhodocyclaceae bacterium]|nr:AI-2E family transporter [Rhodocyclaceae bacterium]